MSILLTSTIYPITIPVINKTNYLNTTSSYRSPFDVTGIVVGTVVLLFLAVFGIFGNVLTMYVITKSSKLRSIFNYFIASLCVSDLLSALLSPLFIYRRTWGFDNWKISHFLCKLFWGGDVGTSVATSLHILCFSFLRLISVLLPLQYKAIQKIHVKICIIAIWTISIGCGSVPFVIWFYPRKMNRLVNSKENAWPSCTVGLGWLPQFQDYTLSGYIIFFYIPFGLITMISLVISGVICNRRRKRRCARTDVAGVNARVSESMRRHKENQAILQLVLIVGSFMLGYLPHTAYHFYASSTKAVTHEDEVAHWWFGMAEYMCLRTSECLNPIFYNLASSSMRNETMTVLRRAFKSCSVSREDNSLRVTTDVKISSIQARTLR